MIKISEYNKKMIDFIFVEKTCQNLVNNIKSNKKQLISILTEYETNYVAEDEINRTIDLLENIKENKKYFNGEKVGSIATFLPSNQPLYVFFCFAVIPSFQSRVTYVRVPKSMEHFFYRMTKNINIVGLKIKLINRERKCFLDLTTETFLDKKTNKRKPKTNVVIFTGKKDNAEKIKKFFHKEVLFIFNGSGHNPVVVTKTAVLSKAAKSVLRLQLYNQGQDCAAPNSILVHNDIYNIFLKKIIRELRKVKIGEYKDKKVLVGPITRTEGRLTC